MYTLLSSWPLLTPPRRAYKNIIASAEFPEALRKRITRVIDFSHLKAKFKTFDAQRKLYSEHDLFLGDDRIINRLPKALGKTFYRSTTKRPIPVVFAKPRAKVGGKRVKKEQGKDEINSRPAAEIAAEIERAVGSALVHLSPSTSTAIRVGYAGWKPEQVSANVESLIEALAAKNVVTSKSLKAIYLKGPETIALPIWHTDELWLESKDVLQDGPEELKAVETTGEKAASGKKRKSLDGPGEAEKKRPAKKPKVPDSNDDKLDQQISDQKARLKKQKSAARKAMEE